MGFDDLDVWNTAANKILIAGDIMDCCYTVRCPSFRHSRDFLRKLARMRKNMESGKKKEGKKERMKKETDRYSTIDAKHQLIFDKSIIISGGWLGGDY